MMPLGRIDRPQLTHGPTAQCHLEPFASVDPGEILTQPMPQLARAHLCHASHCDTSEEGPEPDSTWRSGQARCGAASGLCLLGASRRVIGTGHRDGDHRDSDHAGRRSCAWRLIRPTGPPWTIPGRLTESPTDSMRGRPAVPCAYRPGWPSRASSRPRHRPDHSPGDSGPPDRASSAWMSSADDPGHSPGRGASGHSPGRGAARSRARRGEVAGAARARRGAA